MKYKTGDKIKFQYQGTGIVYDSIVQADGCLHIAWNDRHEGTGKSVYGKGSWENIFGKEWVVLEENLAVEQVVFTKEMVKPFMRIVTKGYGTWIAVPNVQEYTIPDDGEIVMCGGGAGGWMDIDFERNDDYQIVEVCTTPEHNVHMLNPDVCGDTIWKRKSQTQKDIEAAIEKATADKAAMVKSGTWVA